LSLLSHINIPPYFVKILDFLNLKKKLEIEIKITQIDSYISR